jgi:hypothetical protein
MAIQSNRAFAGTPDVNCSYTSNNTLGNTSVAVAYVIGPATDPTANVNLVDTQGNSYALVAHAFNTQSDNWVGMYVAYNIKAGANTVEFTTTVTGVDTILYIAEEPASSGTRASNATSQVSGPTSSPATTLASTVSGDVCVAFGAAMFSGTTQTPGVFGSNAASTIISDGGALFEDGTSSGGASINATTVGSDFWWSIVAVAMKPAGTPVNTLYFGSD